MRASIAAGIVAAWALVAARPAAAASIDFLHIEANEGGSSGGHAALRFGDATYHFQNVDGLLLLAREGSQRFLHDYALLENRPIHVRRIELPEPAARAARARFSARLSAQRSQLDALAAARAERALLAWLLAHARGEARAAEPGPALPGAGYFEAAPSGGAPDPALAALRERVVRERGEAFFARRRFELRAALGALAPEPAPELPAPLAAGRSMPFAYGFGARYVDLAAGLVALDVLEDARPLRSPLLRSADAPALQLADDERLALRRFAERQEASALRLLDGSRPDWGPALLVGMARLAAIHASLRDGRLHVLDAYAEGAPSLAPERLARRRELLPAVAEESGSVVRAALRRFVARDASQPSWADVEDAANRHLELLGAWREGRALRAEPERLVPGRSARLHAPGASLASEAALAQALPAAQARERWLAAETRRLHGYHLLAHNCVSELFATLNSAFADPSLAAAALGGHVDGRSELAFVPFVSAARVEQRYRVQQAFTIPSLRGARVARMRAVEGPLRVWLRESSPLSARAIRPGERDSFFLFYTDHVVWPRPLLGALNLAAGAGEAALGLLRAPLDGGQMLLRGLRGSLMSLPELAFVNLRKGSNDWVPRDAWRDLGSDPARTGAPPLAFESLPPVR